MRRVIAWAGRHHTGVMLGLAVGVLLSGCVFYVEGLVPADLVMPDGSEIPCGTPLAPQGGEICADAGQGDVLLAAIAFLLMLCCIGAMIALAVIRSRQPWQKRR